METLLMKKTTLLLAILILSPSAFSKKAETTEKPRQEVTKDAEAQPKGFDHTHAGWTEILKNFVITKGPVSQFNYKSLKENPQSLNTYLTKLSAVTKKDFDSWSNPQKMSFWINAYNAYTVKLIIDNYPVKSIKDIGGFFSSPWKKEFFKIFGKKFYLDKIEHEILRKNFKEPRIHFAVNCASIGCPALRDEAFTAENLEEQLQEQAVLFMKDTTRNSVNHEKKTVTVSKIFKWFKEDFGTKDNKVIAYVFPFMKGDSDQLETWQKYDLEYSDYDWKLNEVKN